MAKGSTAWPQHATTVKQQNMLLHKTYSPPTNHIVRREPSPTVCFRFDHGARQRSDGIGLCDPTAVRQNPMPATTHHQQLPT